MDGWWNQQKWDGQRGKTYRSFELTLKNQAEVARIGYLLNPNFMLLMLYVNAYAYSQDYYNKTAYSGYQIILDDKALQDLIHQGIQADLHSTSKLRHTSGIMVFLDLQDTYRCSHLADNKQYASHLNIQLSLPFNSTMSNVSTYIKRFLNKAMLHKECTNGTLNDQYLTTFLTHCAPSFGIKNHEWNAIVEMQNQRRWDLHTTIKYAIIYYIPSDKTNVCGAQSVKT